MHVLEFPDLVIRVVFEVSHHEVRKTDFNQSIAEIGIDSVELMEIFGMLEEELGVCLPEEQLAEVFTFDDIVHLLKRVCI